jgi:hypothetical protein
MNEWRQVEYLLIITKPFFEKTNILSKTQDIIVYSIFSIYNQLFTYLNETKEKLEQKAVLWKKILKVIYSVQKKLTKYYTVTDNNLYGSVYVIATILCPFKRLRYFDNNDW